MYQVGNRVEISRLAVLVMICPRCKREAVGWPLMRPDICSPDDWAYCIRNPETIAEKASKS